MSAETGAPSGTVDGRALRREANHRAITEAVYTLVRRHGRMPEVDEVAAEAGVAPRTVFRQFSELDKLWESMNDRVLRDLVELAGSDEPTGVLVTDVLHVVACRARLYEHLRPFKKAIRLQVARKGPSPWLSGIEEIMYLSFRSALQRRLGPFAKSTMAFEAIDMALSLEAWERLRADQGLTGEQASDVLRLICLRLLDDA